MRKGTVLMATRKKFLLAGCFALLAAILTALVLFVDVAAIGPEGSKVGLSSINKTVHDLTGVSFRLYKITEYIGYAVLLVAALFAAFGLWQAIQRRSVAKVDRDILLLGALYAVVLLIYVFFEKVIVNYRPVVMPDEEALEASFPSTHTLLACTIMGSAIMVLGKYVRKRNLCTILQAVCAGMMTAVVVGRFFSGVHWLTDIVASLLISAALLLLFSGLRARWTKAD